MAEVRPVRIRVLGAILLGVAVVVAMSDEGGEWPPLIVKPRGAGVCRLEDAARLAEEAARPSVVPATVILIPLTLGATAVTVAGVRWRDMTSYTVALLLRGDEVATEDGDVVVAS